MQRWSIVIGLIAIVFALIFQPSFQVPLQRILFTGFGAPQASDEHELALEVASLKAGLAEIVQKNRAANDWPVDSVPAFVYSRYPFNFRNEIVITVGRVHGVEVGNAVVVPVVASTIGKPIMIGTVTKVFESTSLVRTIFDTAFQTPARIGEEGIDTLFIGGLEPRLTLIPKTARPKSGDAVYTASPEVPYGLPLGTLGDVHPSENQVFQESEISVPYDLNDVRMVAVVMNQK